MRRRTAADDMGQAEGLRRPLLSRYVRLNAAVSTRRRAPAPMACLRSLLLSASIEIVVFNIQHFNALIT